jgi:hypothetical protein
MRKYHLFKLAVLFIILNSLFLTSGCSSSNDNNATANVVVQLTKDGTTAYPVDQMTVSIQQSGGSVLTGVTDTNGVATITVTGPGDYDVISVAGVDATSLAQGSTAGREFVKGNPLTDPFPYLTYSISGVTVTVTDPGYDYNVNITIPKINEVTVLQVGSATSDTNGNVTVAAGTAAFTGRVILTNLSFNDNSDGLAIISSDPNSNEIHLLMDLNVTPPTTYATFWGGSPYTETPLGYVNSYTQAGPIYFEAPGTDSGDWALGYNLSATDLKTRGSATSNINFPAFNGGTSNYVLNTWSILGGTGHIYSFAYRIFQFTQL